MIRNKFQRPLSLNSDVIDQLNFFKREGETYDDVIRKLLLMDSKYSPIQEIFEYVFVTYRTNKVFRIIYQEDSYKIEYYNHDKGFIDNIKAWNDSVPISKFDRDLFEKFIEKEDYASILYDLDYDFNYNYQFKIGCINKQSK